MQDSQQAVEPSAEVVAEGTIVPQPDQGQELAQEGAKEQILPPPGKQTEEEQRVASRFAALSRKEKAIRERERQIQAQMNELQARLDAFKAQEEEVNKWKTVPERIRREPLKVFEEAGLTPEQLAEIMLNGGKLTPDMELRESERALKAEIEAVKRQLAEKEEKELNERYEAQLNAFVQELTSFANNTPDYELIRANDAVDLVYQVIEQHHSETGEILDNKTACDAVEEYLLEEAKKLVDREKVRKLVGAPSPAPKAAQGKPSVTLSNTQAAQVPSTGRKQLSYEESIAEAAKLIKWQE